MADLFGWVARFAADLLVIGALPLHHAAAANVLEVDDLRCVLGLDLLLGLKVSVVEFWVGMRRQIVECVVVFLLLSIKIKINKKMRDYVSNDKKGTRMVSVLYRGIFGIWDMGGHTCVSCPSPSSSSPSESMKREESLRAYFCRFLSGCGDEFWLAPVNSERAGLELGSSDAESCPLTSLVCLSACCDPWLLGTYSDSTHERGSGGFWWLV